MCTPGRLMLNMISREDGGSACNACPGKGVGHEIFRDHMYVAFCDRLPRGAVAGEGGEEAYQPKLSVVVSVSRRGVCSGALANGALLDRQQGAGRSGHVSLA